MGGEPKCGRETDRLADNLLAVHDHWRVGEPGADERTPLQKFRRIPEIVHVGQGYRPGEAARRGRHDACFTPRRIAYIVQQYKLRSRYDRLRERGMLTKQEAAARLDIHEQTVTSWARHGLITSHAYNGHYCLYELPESNLPEKKCSRWNRLVDRAATRRQTPSLEKVSTEAERDVV